MFASEQDNQNINVGSLNYTGTGASKGFSESISDAWRSTRFSGVFTSEQNNLHDEFESYIEKIAETTGKRLNNPYEHGDVEFYMNAVQMTNTLGAFNVAKKQIQKHEGTPIKKFYQELDKLKAKNPNLEYRNFEDIRAGIKKRGQEMQSEINDGRIANSWGSFVGSAAAIMSDPINVTTTLMTMGAGSAVQTSLRAAIGKAVMREAGLNMISETAVQAKVYPYKQELEEDYDFMDAAENIALAGVGSSILTAGTMGGHSLLKATLNKFNHLKNKGIKFSPSEEDFAFLAERKLAADDYLDETNILGTDEYSKNLHRDMVLSEQARILNDEKQQLGNLYDNIKLDPLKDYPAVWIEDESFGSSLFEKGEYKLVTGGNSKRGWGLVKIIWKHGEKSSDPIQVTRDDVINFPKIFREYEPFVQGKDNEYRIWSVRRQDGQQLLYIDKIFDADKQRHVISIHALKSTQADEMVGQFSSKRNPSVSQSKLSTLAEDTAQRTYHRRFESEELDGNITSLERNVNHKPLEVSYPQLDEIENMLVDEDKLIPLREIDGEVEAVSAREITAQLKNEDSWIEHINSCIMEFGK